MHIIAVSLELNINALQLIASFDRGVTIKLRMYDHITLTNLGGGIRKRPRNTGAGRPIPNHLQHKKCILGNGNVSSYTPVRSEELLFWMSSPGLYIKNVHGEVRKFLHGFLWL